ncbi:galectin-3-like [Ambystoma mexicanum]|uniref:galectin-3-like n=1 Tax=Ambystoma mexicanum TaxID=8296 RepID=UPI0037E6FC9C
MLYFIAVCLLFIKMGSAEEPFRMDFNGGLQPGTLVTVHAVIPENSQRFAIEFHRDPSNIPVHINARFDYTKKLYTICNTMINGKWGTEQETHGNFPFKHGRPSKIDIDCEEEEFKMYVDNKLYLTYKPRTGPLRSIKYLTVMGATTVMVVCAPK